MVFEAGTPEKRLRHAHRMRLSDKDLANEKFECSSITFLPDLCLKVAKMHMLLSFSGVSALNPMPI